MAASRLRHAAAVRRHVSSAPRPRGTGGEEDGTGSGGAGTVRGRGDRARGGDRLRDRERCLAARAALPSMALIASSSVLPFSLAVIHAGRLSTPRPRPRGGGIVFA